MVIQESLLRLKLWSDLRLPRLFGVFDMFLSFVSLLEASPSLGSRFNT